MDGARRGWNGGICELLNPNILRLVQITAELTVRREQHREDPGQFERKGESCDLAISMELARARKELQTSSAIAVLRSREHRLRFALSTTTRRGAPLPSTYEQYLLLYL